MSWVWYQVRAARCGTRDFQARPAQPYVESAISKRARRSPLGRVRAGTGAAHYVESSLRMRPGAGIW